MSAWGWRRTGRWPAPTGRDSGEDRWDVGLGERPREAEDRLGACRKVEPDRSYPGCDTSAKTVTYGKLPHASVRTASVPKASDDLSGRADVPADSRLRAPARPSCTPMPTGAPAMRPSSEVAVERERVITIRCLMTTLVGRCASVWQVYRGGWHA
jgi:hypothetical protein